MHWFARALCVLAIAAPGAVAAASPAVDAGKIAAVDKAAEAFLALAKDAYRTGQPPRQSDPAVKPLLDTVFDTADLNAQGPLPIADLTDLSDWTLRTVAVGGVYVLAGTGIPDLVHAGSLDAKAQQQILHNTVAFAPEMGRYIDSEIQLEQALIDSVLAEMAAHPEKFRSPKSESGLAKMRAGLKQTLSGALTTFLTPGLGATWIQGRLTVLAAIMPSAAKFLSPDDRHGLHDLALQVGAKLGNPAIEGTIGSLAQALAR